MPECRRGGRSGQWALFGRGWEALANASRTGAWVQGARAACPLRALGAASGLGSRGDRAEAGGDSRGGQSERADRAEGHL